MIYAMVLSTSSTLRRSEVEAVSLLYWPFWAAAREMGPDMSFFLERHGGTFRMLDACKACRAQVEHGSKTCPQCGAKLARPGASLQTAGWVTTIVSLIPLGFVTVKQGPLAPLGL